MRYAQVATRLAPVDEATFNALASHFSEKQLVDICLIVGLSGMVNRFHATFHTDLDERTVAAADEGDRTAGACPIRRPPVPGAGA